MNKRSVMLGCWGIGGSMRVHGSGKTILPNRELSIEKGPFIGFKFPSAKDLQKVSNPMKWHLPPLARSGTSDGIDFMPFILYDNVTIDNLAFSSMIGRHPSLALWGPSKQSVQILESLASDGVIVLENYTSRLNDANLDNVINTMISLDLSDNNIIKPCKESLHLWIKFYKDLFGLNDQHLSAFSRMLSYLEKGSIDARSETFGYLYECVADINRVLLLSQLLDQPIYEWEDYRQFYKYKFLRSGNLTEERSLQKTFKEIFNVFLPNFQISSYSQLLDIRNDPRLDSVRSLAAKLTGTSINEDLVLTAYEDVLSMKTKMQTFTKYSSFLGTTLSFFIPGVITNVLPFGADNIAHKWLNRKIKWQAFFVERAIAYKRSDIEKRLKKK